MRKLKKLTKRQSEKYYFIQGYQAGLQYGLRLMAEAKEKQNANGQTAPPDESVSQPGPDVSHILGETVTDYPAVSLPGDEGVDSGTR